jgi:hypothetical protein
MYPDMVRAKELWAALRTRVVTDEELLEILAIGPDLARCDLKRWSGSEDVERFDRALTRQALLRTARPFSGQNL